ncbi:MAG: GNAT family N-acetyltransferase [Candidatus Eisenbacteria bacterium]|nr:GNAT family N-acetyltransferase [Candidatus Eisenbacteria bacterium]
MSLHPGTRPPTLDRLGTSDLIETFAFLDRDPVLNVYLLAVLLRDALVPSRDEFWAARRGGGIEALMMLGTGSGSALPVGDDEVALGRLGAHAVERLGALPRRFQVIGEREAIVPFLSSFASAGLTPRLRRDQVYMALRHDRLAGIEPLAALRPARPEDYALVYETGARLRAEELEEDPRDIDPAAYARRVEEECREESTFVWREGDQLRFRASVSARTVDAVQISGVYTPPECRGRGFATRGVAELCRRLFPHSRAACLFVNGFNAPALAVYRKLGFESLAAWGSAFFSQGP